MRIIDCIQGSEEWERLRHRPTCSNFAKLVTPERGQLSTQYKGYVGTIVAKRLGVYSPPPPTFWMEWGTEHEPLALSSYGRDVHRVGFIESDCGRWGGSPDALVEDETGKGGVEIKCPAPETLIGYHIRGEMPKEYKPQIQGLLLLTGRAWWDFYAWHPGLTPFTLRVEPDLTYHAALLEAIDKVDSLIQETLTKVHAVNNNTEHGLDWS